MVLDDVAHHHQICDRRVQQYAQDVANVLFEAGHGDVAVTTSVMNKLLSRPEMLPFMPDGHNARVTEKADAKRVLSQELYGSLVAGQNTVETVKDIKVGVAHTVCVCVCVCVSHCVRATTCVCMRVAICVCVRDVHVSCFNFAEEEFQDAPGRESFHEHADSRCNERGRNGKGGTWDPCSCVRVRRAQ